VETAKLLQEILKKERMEFRSKKKVRNYDGLRRMIPCKDCVTYAICKQKHILKVVGDCSIVRELLKKEIEEDEIRIRRIMVAENYERRFNELSKVLNSWYSDASNYATSKRLIWLWLSEGRF
jgi:hypothetical protein